MSGKIGMWTRGLTFDITGASFKPSRLLFLGDVVLILAHSRDLRILKIDGNGATSAMLSQASQVAAGSLQHLEVGLSGTPQTIGAAFNIIGTFRNLRILIVKAYPGPHTSEASERVVAPQALEFLHLTELTLHLSSFDSERVNAVFSALSHACHLPRMTECYLFLGPHVRAAECRGLEGFFDSHSQLQRCMLRARLEVMVQLLPHITASAIDLSGSPHPTLASVLPSRIEELSFSFDMDCTAGCAHKLCQRRAYAYVERSVDI
jgi:hypothetical protein